MSVTPPSPVLLGLVELVRWKAGPPMTEEVLADLGAWVCSTYGVAEEDLVATGDQEWLAFYAAPEAIRS